MSCSIPSLSIIGHVNCCNSVDGESGNLTSKGCEEGKRILPKLKTIKKEKKNSWEECRESCNNLDDCNNFKFDLRRGICYLLKIRYVKNRRFSSGAKYCTSTTIGDHRIYII